MNRLRATVMVRRMKRDVLAELPAKSRQMIELPAGSAEALVEREWSSYRAQEAVLVQMREAARTATVAGNDEEYARAVKDLGRARTAAFAAMATVRRDVAMKKLPLVIAHLADSLAPAHKIVVFAHHHDVINAVHAAFEECSVVVTGDTPSEQRHENVRRFQEDPQVLLFVGNIQAAGVGVTLTAASHVVMSELDWVPARLTQAEDRCHRIGQSDNVLVQHLVLEGSLDAVMARRLIEKQEMADKSLNVRRPVGIPVGAGAAATADRIV